MSLNFIMPELSLNTERQKSFLPRDFRIAFVEPAMYVVKRLSIRDDEIAAESMGINIARYKVQSFAVSAFMAGVGGCLYAHFLGYINPSDFGFLKSIDMLSMVVLGGLGSVPGAVLGASILTAAPESLRFMSQYRMLVYGALLVFLMVFRPNGLMGGVDLTGLVLRALGVRPHGTAGNREKRT